MARAYSASSSFFRKDVRSSKAKWCASPGQSGRHDARPSRRHAGTAHRKRIGTHPEQHRKWSPSSATRSLLLPVAELGLRLCLPPGGALTLRPSAAGAAASHGPAHVSQHGTIASVTACAWRPRSSESPVCQTGASPQRGLYLGVVPSEGSGQQSSACTDCSTVVQVELKIVGG
eukprot:scaffold3142_cov416-Prasinococcus_capsulatus_cf.AAC.2